MSIFILQKEKNHKANWCMIGKNGNNRNIFEILNIQFKIFK